MKVNLNLSESEGWSGSWTFKLITITIMVLLLLIPLGMVENMIYERQQTAREVEEELSAQWGHAQILTGPVLNIPVLLAQPSAKKQNDEKEVVEQWQWIHVMPNELNISGSLDPEIRYRGIFKNVVYKSTFKMKGNFGKIDNQIADAVKIDWGNAYITFGLTDNRGIVGDFDFKWMDNKLKPEPGMVVSDLAESGISFKAPLTLEQNDLTKPFELSLILTGSGSLSINPIGQITEVNITSTWPDPSFTGSYLPTTRNITEKGFNAYWVVTHLNRNYPQQWTGKQFSIQDQSLGVNLFIPVNHYQKSLRSLKYGMLFIVLTILVFIFIELTKKKKIHLVQYLLVGLALVMFFSVLTALSEHLGFNYAYLIAASVIISMVTYYTHSILKVLAYTIWVFVLLTILYAFLFSLMQLNDYAFLAGNIGLIVILGIIMKASLKISVNNVDEINN